MGAGVAASRHTALAGASGENRARAAARFRSQVLSLSRRQNGYYTNFSYLAQLLNARSRAEQWGYDAGWSGVEWVCYEAKKAQHGSQRMKHL